MLKSGSVLAAVLGLSMLMACKQGVEAQPMAVDIGGRRLLLNCAGKAKSPAVILEAGSEATSEAWRLVQLEVAKFAYVCSYDRAGLGRSDPAGHEESIAENVSDLHALLQKAGVAGPYVLVGHSSGGLRVRLYQSRYSGEVAAMVLVDSAHEEQVWRFNDAIPGAVRGIPQDPAGLARMGMLPARQHLLWHADIPLIVIEHGKPMELPPAAREHAQQAEDAMHALQLDLASRSKYGELRKAEHSGHDIPMEEPQAVVKAIQDILSRTKPI
ncbi:MAG TPA: alpha/beta fold hydrolase [Terracidiphilus sp.]|nr:alpha/beta fold hydrolase [Terracidiphilus sp.]